MFVCNFDIRYIAVDPARSPMKIELNTEAAIVLVAFFVAAVIVLVNLFGRI
jgi:hypothetical protein